jgi:hypothetical protein
LLRHVHCTKYVSHNNDPDIYCILRKKSPLTGKLVTELRKKLVRWYVWSIVLYDSETWALRKLERKYLKSFEMWCWWRMEKIKWPEKVTNEQVIEHIGEKRTLLNNIIVEKSIGLVIF